MSAHELGVNGGRGWDRFLTAADRAVFSRAGYGRAAGYGTTPAVLVIDATEEFCGPNLPVLEAIAAAPLACGDVAWRAVAVIERVLASARVAGVRVAYSVMQDRSADAGTWSHKRHSDAVFTFVPPGCSGRVVEALNPLSDDLVLTKRKPSVFHGTDLHRRLTGLGIDTLVLCGGTTSGCVRATAVDAFSFGYRVVVVEDGCFDRGEASHWMSLFDLHQKYADVVPAVEVERHLRSFPARSDHEV